MRKRILASVAALLGSAGLVIAEEPAPLLPPAPPALAPDSAHPALAAPPGKDDSGDRFWGGADYLMWWTKASPAPPLLITGPAPLVAGPVVTTSPPPPGTPFVGFLSITGVPTSLTLSTPGIPLNHDTEDDVRSGARFVMGGWLDSGRTLGLEGSFFFLASRSATFADGSNGTPALAIPYINALTGKEAGYAVAQPSTSVTSSQYINTGPGVFVHLQDTTSTDAFSGKAVVTSTSRLLGTETNAVWAPDVLGKRVQLLAGFRYAQLDEGLNIASSVTHDHSDTTSTEPALGIPGAVPFTNSSTTLTTRWDQFDAHNNFYGAQVGARGEYRWGRLSLLAGAKVAVGTVEESVNVLGASGFSTTATVTPTQTILFAGVLPLTVPTGEPAATTTTSGHSVGGLFAQPTNIGHYSRNVFAVVPEANFKAGYQITNRLRATVGYSFLYMSDVVRPGDQIDRAINPSLLASPPVNGTPARPLFQFRSTDFWAQGVDFGLEFRF